MIWPILKLIRLHRWFSRLMQRQRIPLWLNDALGFVKYLNVFGWIMTFVYSGFYPRHFYHRMGRVVARPAGGAKGWRYPYLLRPIPYLIAFVALFNLLRVLGVPLFADVEEFSVLEFNTVVAALTFVSPLLAAAAIVSLLILVAILRVFAFGLDGISSGESKLSDAARINWWFFRVLFRRHFWTQYRYGELIPALLYYSINALILVPVAYGTFTRGAELALDWLPPLERPLFQTLMTALQVVVLAVLAITLAYLLVLRPLLYAVFFRSRTWLARNGVCPDLIDLFGDPERDPAALVEMPGQELRARTAYLDLDLEKSAPEAAYLRWTRITDERHRFVEDDLRRVHRSDRTETKEN